MLKTILKVLNIFIFIINVILIYIGYQLYQMIISATQKISEIPGNLVTSFLDFF